MNTEEEKIKNGITRKELPSYNKPFFGSLIQRALSDGDIESEDEYRFAYPGIDYRTPPLEGSRIKVWLSPHERFSVADMYGTSPNPWLFVKHVPEMPASEEHAPFIWCHLGPGDDSEEILIYYHEIQYVGLGPDLKSTTKPLPLI